MAVRKIKVIQTKSKDKKRARKNKTVRNWKKIKIKNDLHVYENKDLMRHERIIFI